MLRTGAVNRIWELFEALIEQTRVDVAEHRHYLVPADVQPPGRRVPDGIRTVDPEQVEQTSRGLADVSVEFGSGRHRDRRQAELFKRWGCAPAGARRLVDGKARTRRGVAVDARVGVVEEDVGVRARVALNLRATDVGLVAEVQILLREDRVVAEQQAQVERRRVGGHASRDVARGTGRDDLAVEGRVEVVEIDRRERRDRVAEALAVADLLRAARGAPLCAADSLRGHQIERSTADSHRAGQTSRAGC